MVQKAEKCVVQKICYSLHHTRVVRGAESGEMCGAKHLFERGVTNGPRDGIFQTWHISPRMGGVREPIVRATKSKKESDTYLPCT